MHFEWNANRWADGQLKLIWYFHIFPLEHSYLNRNTELNVDVKFFAIFVGNIAKSTCLKFYHNKNLLKKTTNPLGIYVIFFALWMVEPLADNESLRMDSGE